MTVAARATPWKTPFALRTYAAGALWAVGAIFSGLTQVSDAPGWFAIRIDAAGIAYAAAAVAGGSNFFGAGVRAARTLRLDMNFLMSVAIVAAVLIGEPFEAATLAFLFSIAELLERYAVDRGRRSIARLVELAPEQADRLVADGSIETVPSSGLRAGDRVRIRPGDKIPADGRVVAGTSSVNEATITGESLPRPKAVGDLVYASTLNVDGALDVEVTADAAHSTLARIVQLVRDAEQNRAPIEQLVQRFARVYTPAVTLLAAGTMLAGPLITGGNSLEWFVRGLTLLVIACPCALVIATPVSVVSALSAAARHGVLIKGGEHLERLGSVRALAVDKTGTITTGRLRVLAFDADPPASARELLRQVAAVEARAEHPIARAITRFAREQGVASASDMVDAFRAEPGRGVEARVDGRVLHVGTDAFVHPESPASADAIGSGTRVFVRTDDGIRGVFDLGDDVRPNARTVIANVQRLGVRPVVLMTGDAAEPASVVGATVGVDAVHARLMPADKADLVTRLREQHGSVAMLGDGVNDAPALASATVGIAMGAAGSPATIETADVALMADDLAMLPYAIGLARRTRRVIRFNITLAIGLKALLAAGAVVGVVTLATAVLIGDMGASVAVTVNALRLGAAPRER